MNRQPIVTSWQPVMAQAQDAIDAAGVIAGPLGVIVAVLVSAIITALAAAVVVLWRRNNALHDQNAALIRETLDTLHDVTGVMESLRERLPMDLAGQIGKVETTVNTRADRIEDKINNIK